MGPFQLLFLIVGLGAIIAFIFFNISLQKAMREVHPKDRKTGEPGLIWLNLIPFPFWGQIWTMLFGITACKGINKRAQQEIAPTTLAYVFTIAGFIPTIISFTIGSNTGADIGFLRTLSIVNMIAGLVALTTWIIFWSQLVQATKRVKSMDTPEAGSDDLLDTDF